MCVCVCAHTCLCVCLPLCVRQCVGLHTGSEAKVLVSRNDEEGKGRAG